MANPKNVVLEAGKIAGWFEHRSGKTIVGTVHENVGGFISKPLHKKVLEGTIASIEFELGENQDKQPVYRVSNVNFQSKLALLPEDMLTGFNLNISL